MLSPNSPDPAGDHAAEDDRRHHEMLRAPLPGHFYRQQAAEAPLPSPQEEEEVAATAATAQQPLPRQQVLRQQPLRQEPLRQLNHQHREQQQRLLERQLDALLASFQAEHDGRGAAIFDVRPVVNYGGDLFRRFFDAWTRVRNKQMQLVFHGTPAGNVDAICLEGLDAGRRAGQAFGAGEYFGRQAPVSIGYCRGGQTMVVFAVLLDESGVTHADERMVVVHEADHQLPVFAMDFRACSGGREGAEQLRAECAEERAAEERAIREAEERARAKCERKRALARARWGALCASGFAVDARDHSCSSREAVAAVLEVECGCRAVDLEQLEDAELRAKEQRALLVEALLLQLPVDERTPRVRDLLRSIAVHAATVAGAAGYTPDGSPLPDEQLNDKVAELVARLLPGAPLLSLNLSSNAIGDEGARALAAALPRSRVTKLNVSNCLITEAGAGALAGAVREVAARGVRLAVNVRYNNLVTVTAQGELDAAMVDARVRHEVRESLRCSTGRRRVSVSGHVLSHDDIRYLGECLPGSGVSALELTYAGIDDGKALALARGLEQALAGSGLLGLASSLEEVCLHANDITDCGAVALARALTSARRMSVFSLTTNRLTDAGIQQVSEILGERVRFECDDDDDDDDER